MRAADAIMDRAAVMQATLTYFANIPLTFPSCEMRLFAFLKSYLLSSHDEMNSVIRADFYTP